MSRAATYPRCPGGGKICFPSRAKARRAARNRHESIKDKLRVYECPRCGCWHITKQPQR